MAEKLPCTAVEKRKPLGIIWLGFCELAQGAPRRPGRLFLRYSASENRKIFEKNLIGVNFGIRVFGGWAGIQNRVNPEPGTRPDRQNGRTRTRTLKWGIFRHCPSHVLPAAAAADGDDARSSVVPSPALASLISEMVFGGECWPLTARIAA